MSGTCPPVVRRPLLDFGIVLRSAWYTVPPRASREARQAGVEPRSRAAGDVRRKRSTVTPQNAALDAHLHGRPSELPPHATGSAACRDASSSPRVRRAVEHDDRDAFKSDEELLAAWRAGAVK